MKLKTKVFLLLFSGSIAVGSANVSHEITNLSNKEMCYMRITRAMREDGVDYQEVDSSELISEDCSHVSALLMEFNVESDIQLFRITNKNQMESTIKAYRGINMLYKKVGIYVRYHNEGEYLLVAGGNFNEEDFNNHIKKLKEAIENVKEILGKEGK